MTTQRQIEIIQERGDTYRDGFIALRDLTDHVIACRKCVQECGGGEPCDVRQEAQLKIRAANQLAVREGKRGT